MIAEAEQLLRGLDVGAVRAEMARRKLEADLRRLIEIAREEAKECRRTQSDATIRQRALQLLDCLKTFKLNE